MSKRLWALALCLLLLLTSACGEATQQETEGYDLYFLEADLSAAPGGDALRPEVVQLPQEEDQTTQQLAESLVTALLAGPADDTLRNPIPPGTALISLELEGSRARVDLTFPYRSLSGVALTLADYAITLTLTQLPEISTVTITVRGQELAYRDSQSFTERDVLFSSNEDVIGTLPVTLYFLNDNGTLTPEARVLDLYEGDTQVSAVVRALENGPEARSLNPSLPEGFQVKSVWLEEDECYVNLSSALLPELPQDADLDLALRALARSLRSLGSVGEVQFLVDGEFTGSYGGVNVALPYTD